MWVLLAALFLSQADAGGRPLKPKPENNTIELVRGSKTVRQTRELMHTKVTVAITDPPRDGQADHHPDFDAVFAIFARIDSTMNEWRDGSVLSQINSAAGGAAVGAPKDLCEVIALSLEGAKRTHGLFDPTWAALNDLWVFGNSVNGEPPDPAVLKKRCGLVGWKNVEVKPAARPTPELACTVRLKTAGMKLGLGGVVRGWGVDQAVKLLRSLGYRNFFVQAGGDLYLSGKVGDRPWRVGIRDPRGAENEGFARAEVSDATFSTSGDYEHYFLKDGVRYHHLIDVRTCEPARASVSATVLAKSAVEAEFLTKATFVLGPTEGQKLAATFGAQLVLVDADGGVSVSKGLQGKVEVWPPSGFGHDAGPRDGGDLRPR